MQTYSTSSKLSNGVPEAMNASVTTLTNNGFAIRERADDSAVLTGPGLNSTKQNPLLGATRINLKVQDGQLVANAELGGVESMQRFVTRFPILLCVGLGLFFGVLAAVQVGLGPAIPGWQGWQLVLLAMLIAMIPGLPWLFLGPMVGRITLTKTQNAIQTLVQNATFATDAGSSVQ